MQTLANDFVSLPIIVSDYDALIDSKPLSEAKPSRPVIDVRSNLTSSSPSPSRAPNPSPSDKGSSLASHQNWSTGFTDFVDSLWSHMTNGMKSKLREACVEVLRRTEDPSEEEKLWGVWDEDARMLD
ncbi:hypothetical protein KC343_g12653 [Hortaea werneckii]|uniref:Uncharacterized protein n=1 Tax=Hortaea werneckii TaxID=91943 RepID=A0A3M7EWS4_HORWE|nr:hypothetical protein KC317_g13106 [Hortaea werneckii]KAI7583917.1 hypothetical protein KC346_g18078 [Hortaea werneckii]KAI7608562.1 hypothetical protein KC343_g12653 [Hortaea werneckii]KAI7644400.1 hypothetical protein KC319_g12312 [Hortaea werneckii]RMY80970.1 hypothetical protein D0864_08456 [Hortaea werneckii]